MSTSSLAPTAAGAPACRSDGNRSSRAARYSGYASAAAACASSPAPGAAGPAGRSRWRSPPPAPTSALGLRRARRRRRAGATRSRRIGRRALRLQMDVTDLPESYAAIDRAVAELGGIDILGQQRRRRHRRTGAGGDRGRLRPGDVAWNVKSTFFLSQRVARHMIDDRPRRADRQPARRRPAAASRCPASRSIARRKAAVSHLTRCLAVEWGGHGINVNAVAPTFIETPGTAAGARPTRRSGPTPWRASRRCTASAGRSRSAGAVVFLASPAASLITGHTLAGRRRLVGALTAPAQGNCARLRGRAGRGI